jgi:hypothetical protein
MQRFAVNGIKQGKSGVRNTTFLVLCVLQGVMVGSKLMSVGNVG